MCFEGLAQMWYFQGKTSLARECYVNGARTQLCTGRFLRMWATMERRLKNDNQASRIFKAAAKVDPQVLCCPLHPFTCFPVLGSFVISIPTFSC